MDSYQIHRIDNIKELLSLKDEWCALLAEARQTPIFLTYEWVTVWWKHFGRDRELFVLTARDRTGSLRGVAPLMRECWPFSGFGVRMIRFLGHGIVAPVHLSVIARPEESEAVRHSFWQYLISQRKEWDALEVKSLAPETELKAALPDMKGCLVNRQPEVSPFVPLPATWDGYYESLKSKVRRNIRYFTGLLEREHAGQVAFDRVSTAEELKRAMDRLVEMHKKHHRKTSFHNPRFTEFHHELSAVLLRLGWLRFYELRVSGRAIAVIYCFRYGDVVYAYQLGVDYGWARYSPGRLLAAHVIREAIQEKASEFDWLLGGHAYKYEWTNEFRLEPCWMLFSGSRGRFISCGVKLFDVARMVRRKLWVRQK